MSTVIPSLVEALPMARAYGLPAGPVLTVEQNPRALALGVVPAGKGFKLAVRVQHRALLKGSRIEQIRKRAKGEVDVKYIGRVHVRAAANLRSRQRPLVIGCSVGHFKITAGTLGAFVRPRGGGDLAILSNNHVLANENRGRTGDAILQPGSYDGGVTPGDEVAQLGKFIRVRRGQTNFVDAAIATVNTSIKFDAVTMARIGKLKGLGATPIVDELEVSKVGRTTATTKGKITAFELDNVMVDYDMGTLRFDNQLEIEAGHHPFSSGGDSGSLIVDSDCLAVGLLFAGSDAGGQHGHGTTFANPIHPVLDALDVALEL